MTTRSNITESSPDYSIEDAEAEEDALHQRDFSEEAEEVSRTSIADNKNYRTDGDVHGDEGATRSPAHIMLTEQDNQHENKNGPHVMLTPPGPPKTTTTKKLQDPQHFYEDDEDDHDVHHELDHEADEDPAYYSEPDVSKTSPMYSPERPNYQDPRAGPGAKMNNVGRRGASNEASGQQQHLHRLSTPAAPLQLHQTGAPIGPAQPGRSTSMYLLVEGSTNTTGSNYPKRRSSRGVPPPSASTSGGGHQQVRKNPSINKLLIEEEDGRAGPLHPVDQEDEHQDVPSLSTPGSSSSSYLAAGENYEEDSLVFPSGAQQDERDDQGPASSTSSDGSGSSHHHQIVLEGPVTGGHINDAVTSSHHEDMFLSGVGDQHLHHEHVVNHDDNQPILHHDEATREEAQHAALAAQGDAEARAAHEEHLHRPDADHGAVVGSDAEGSSSSGEDPLFATGRWQLDNDYDNPNVFLSQGFLDENSLSYDAGTRLNMVSGDSLPIGGDGGGDSSSGRGGRAGVDDSMFLEGVPEHEILGGGGDHVVHEQAGGLHVGQAMMQDDREDHHEMMMQEDHEHEALMHEEEAMVQNIHDLDEINVGEDPTGAPPVEEHRPHQGEEDVPRYLLNTGNINDRGEGDRHDVGDPLADGGPQHEEVMRAVEVGDASRGERLMLREGAHEEDGEIVSTYDFNSQMIPGSLIGLEDGLVSFQDQGRFLTQLAQKSEEMRSGNQQAAAMFENKLQDISEEGGGPSAEDLVLAARDDEVEEDELAHETDSSQRRNFRRVRSTTVPKLDGNTSNHVVESSVDHAPGAGAHDINWRRGSEGSPLHQPSASSSAQASLPFRITTASDNIDENDNFARTSPTLMSPTDFPVDNKQVRDSKMNKVIGDLIQIEKRGGSSRTRGGGRTRSAGSSKKRRKHKRPSIADLSPSHLILYEASQSIEKYNDSSGDESQSCDEEGSSNDVVEDRPPNRRSSKESTRGRRGARGRTRSSGGASSSPESSATSSKEKARTHHLPREGAEEPTSATTPSVQLVLRPGTGESEEHANNSPISTDREYQQQQRILNEIMLAQHQEDHTSRNLTKLELMASQNKQHQNKFVPLKSQSDDPEIAGREEEDTTTLIAGLLEVQNRFTGGGATFPGTTGPHHQHLLEDQGSEQLQSSSIHPQIFNAHHDPNLLVLSSREGGAREDDDHCSRSQNESSSKATTVINHDYTSLDHDNYIEGDVNDINPSRNKGNNSAALARVKEGMSTATFENKFSDENTGSFSREDVVGGAHYDVDEVDVGGDDHPDGGPHAAETSPAQSLHSSPSERTMTAINNFTFSNPQHLMHGGPSVSPTTRNKRKQNYLQGAEQNYVQGAESENPPALGAATSSDSVIAFEKKEAAQKLRQNAVASAASQQRPGLTEEFFENDNTASVPGNGGHEPADTSSTSSHSNKTAKNRPEILNLPPPNNSTSLLQSRGYMKIILNGQEHFLVPAEDQHDLQQPTSPRFGVSSEDIFSRNKNTFHAVPAPGSVPTSSNANMLDTTSTGQAEQQHLPPLFKNEDEHDPHHPGEKVRIRNEKEQLSLQGPPPVFTEDEALDSKQVSVTSVILSSKRKTSIAPLQELQENGGHIHDVPGDDLHAGGEARSTTTTRTGTGTATAAARDPSSSLHSPTTLQVTSEKSSDLLSQTSSSYFGMMSSKRERVAPIITNFETFEAFVPDATDILDAPEMSPFGTSGGTSNASAKHHYPDDEAEISNTGNNTAGVEPPLGGAPSNNSTSRPGTPNFAQATSTSMQDSVTMTDSVQHVAPTAGRPDEGDQGVVRPPFSSDTVLRSQQETLIAALELLGESSSGATGVESHQLHVKNTKGANLNKSAAGGGLIIIPNSLFTENEDHDPSSCCASRLTRESSSITQHSRASSVQNNTYNVVPANNTAQEEKLEAISARVNSKSRQQHLAPLPQTRQGQHDYLGESMKASAPSLTVSIASSSRPTPPRSPLLPGSPVQSQELSSGTARLRMKAPLKGQAGVLEAGGGTSTTGGTSSLIVAKHSRTSSTDAFSVSRAVSIREPQEPGSNNMREVGEPQPELSSQHPEVEITGAPQQHVQVNTDLAAGSPGLVGRTKTIPPNNSNHVEVQQHSSTSPVLTSQRDGGAQQRQAASQQQPPLKPAAGRASEYYSSTKVPVRQSSTAALLLEREHGAQHDPSVNAHFQSTNFIRWLTYEVSGESEEPDSRKWKRGIHLEDFLKTPTRLEHTLLMGMVLCLDTLLHELTFMPLNVLIAFLKKGLSVQERRLNPIERSEAFRCSILFVNILIIHSIFDFSAWYHYIRSQSFMKLYVFFNMLEIFERLARSIGNDAFDVLLENPDHVQQPTKSAAGGAVVPNAAGATSTGSTTVAGSATSLGGATASISSMKSSTTSSCSIGSTSMMSPYGDGERGSTQPLLGTAHQSVSGGSSPGGVSGILLSISRLFQTLLAAPFTLFNSIFSGLFDSAFAVFHLNTQVGLVLNYTVLWRTLFAIVYCTIHSAMHVVRVLLLNIALSQPDDNAMFLLIVTNNFGELKSSVFKKYEGKGLFVIMASDMVERTYLLVDILLVLARIFFSPRQHLSAAALEKFVLDIAWWLSIMILVEVLIDWFKLSFITKANSLSLATFDYYKDVLVMDVLGSRMSREGFVTGSGGVGAGVAGGTTAALTNMGTSSVSISGGGSTVALGATTPTGAPSSSSAEKMIDTRKSANRASLTTSSGPRKSVAPPVPGGQGQPVGGEKPTSTSNSTRGTSPKTLINKSIGSASGILLQTTSKVMEPHQHFAIRKRATAGAAVEFSDADANLGGKVVDEHEPVGTRTTATSTSLKNYVIAWTKNSTGNLAAPTSAANGASNNAVVPPPPSPYRHSSTILSDQEEQLHLTLTASSGAELTATSSGAEPLIDIVSRRSRASIASEESSAARSSQNTSRQLNNINRQGKTEINVKNENVDERDTSSSSSSVLHAAPTSASTGDLLLEPTTATTTSPADRIIIVSSPQANNDEINKTPLINQPSETTSLIINQQQQGGSSSSSSETNLLHVAGEVNGNYLKGAPTSSSTTTSNKQLLQPMRSPTSGIAAAALSQQEETPASATPTPNHNILNLNQDAGSQHQGYTSATFSSQPGAQQVKVLSRKGTAGSTSGASSVKLSSVRSSPKNHRDQAHDPKLMQLMSTNVSTSSGRNTVAAAFPATATSTKPGGAGAVVLMGTTGASSLSIAALSRESRDPGATSGGGASRASAMVEKQPGTTPLVENKSQQASGASVANPQTTTEITTKKGGGAHQSSSSRMGPGFIESPFRGVYGYAHIPVRRIGFVALPLTTMVVTHLNILLKWFSTPREQLIALALFWVNLLLLKILFSILIVGYSVRRATNLGKLPDLFYDIKAM